MPDIGQLLLLVVVAAVVGVVVALPLLRPAATPGIEQDADVLRLRHRIALEAIRDVDADHRAGSLDDAAHAEQRAEAEEHAVATLVALESTPRIELRRETRPGGRIAAGVGAVIGLALVVGFVVPPPIGLANWTVVNEPLAEAVAQEDVRQATIDRLQSELVADPRDTAVLRQLADSYLAGGSKDDLARGAAVLLLLIGLDPNDADAHRRIVTAYIRAGDYANASAATDALAALEPGSADVAFFRGLIALRGAQDSAAAVAEFDRFLELAPDDPRADMVRGLRSEAAGEVPGS